MEMAVLDGIDVTDMPAIEGVSFRAYAGPSDHPHVAEIETASWIADDVPFVSSVEEVESFWNNMPGCDPYRDVLFAEWRGQPAAYARVNRMVNDDGEQIIWHGCFMRPELRGKGVGTAMFQWCEQRARAMAAEHPHAGPRFMQTWTFGTMSAKIALTQRFGYDPHRYGFMMKRDLNLPISDLDLPAGLETRPVLPEHVRAIFVARNEAFRDHFGHREATEQDYENMARDPYTRMDLWQVAWDTRANEVAGEVRVAIVEPENERFGFRRGYTDPIFVRRPYRKQGVAKALLVRAMHALKRIGMTEAYLGVDAQNPNGALRLYEDMGFVVDQRTFQYRKKVED